MPSISRRGFFGGLSAAAATTTVATAASVSELPLRVWTIVGVDWQHNDEFSYPQGDVLCGQLFYDEAAAQAECRRLCDRFFTELYPTPALFELDWSDYDLDCGPGFDEAAVTWDALRQAGFSDPYTVVSLTVPGAIPDE